VPRKIVRLVDTNCPSSEFAPSLIPLLTFLPRISSLHQHTDIQQTSISSYPIQKMSLTNASPTAVATSARLASRTLAVLPTSARNAALSAIHAALSASRSRILAANAQDLASASAAATEGALSPSLIKRLDLGKPGKYEDMLQGILDVRDLEDPSTSSSSKPPARIIFLK
jgi:hypothetical protein